MTTKPVIVFASAIYPGQFGDLCDYLRKSGMAETYFLTSAGYHAKYKDRGAHILPFQADGAIAGEQGYPLSAKVERASRASRGLLAALQEFEKTRKIDVVVTHSLWGAPHFLYDEIDAAIISYVEFPSYRTHGWDKDYPPDLVQRLGDKNSEMLNFYQALRNDLTIVSSQHVKEMFPKELRGKIEVQAEGHNFGAALQPAADRPFTIGFTARDLSNAKGYDRFYEIADHLLGAGIDAKFVAIGASEGPTYGYEQQWVQRNSDGKLTSFAKHLAQTYPRAAAAIDEVGFLSHSDYVAKLSEIDLFLYPLRFGGANWGLAEILGRGGCVIASDHPFTREYIQDGVNGIIAGDDTADWVKAIVDLQQDADKRKRLGAAARILGQAQSLQSVAPRYMTLFHKAMRARQG